ncbi:MAG: TatA/E family protein of Tat protein translocase [Candidatus Nanohaloarchaea archaeon]|jgi:TatA/E family protein of Tat protein translocase
MALLGPPEILLVVAAIVALVVGPKKLPQLARSLGESKKEFNKSMKEAEDVKDELDETAEEMTDVETGKKEE